MEAIKVNVEQESLAETVLRLALDVGEGMLKNGGEVSRVENTIERICRAWGAVRACGAPPPLFFWCRAPFPLCRAVTFITPCGIFCLVTLMSLPIT